MNHPIARKLAKFFGYFLGIALLFIGIAGPITEIAEASASSDLVGCCVIGPVFIICGGFTCLATRKQFKGWILTALGVDFIGFGLVGAIAVIASRLQYVDLIFLGTFYFRLIAYWIVGPICLVFGLMSRRKTESIDDAS